MKDKIFIVYIGVMIVILGWLLLAGIFGDNQEIYEWKSIDEVGVGAVYCYDTDKNKICVLPDASVVNVIEFNKVKGK